eukprot:s12_g34.t1
MWTGKIDKKYGPGVSGRPGSKKPKVPPSAGSAKKAATETEHTTEGAEEETIKESDPVVEPADVEPKPIVKRKQKEAEPTEGTTRVFKRLKPLQSNSSLDVAGAHSKKERKKEKKEKDQDAKTEAAHKKTRKRQRKDKEEPETNIKTDVDSGADASTVASKRKKPATAAKLLEVKKSKSTEDVSAPPAPSPAPPKAAPKPKRTAAKSQPTAPVRNTPSDGPSHHFRSLSPPCGDAPAAAQAAAAVPKQPAAEERGPGETSGGVPSQPPASEEKKHDETVPSQPAETKQVEKKPEPEEKQVDQQVSESIQSGPDSFLGGSASANAKEYEYGWSEEHLCAWRKEIKGPSLRGPVEYSQKPEFISGVDEDSSADLKEKLKVKAPVRAAPKAQPASAAPKAQPATAPTVSLKGPTEFESTDKGCCKIAVKPQKNRSTIVVMMHKADDAKPTQKLQIVVKPGELPLADCITIMQLFCFELTSGKLELTAVKLRRDEVIQFQKSKGLKKYLEALKDQEADPPYDYRPSEELLQAYDQNQEQDSRLQEVADTQLDAENAEENPCTLANLQCLEPVAVAEPPSQVAPPDALPEPAGQGPPAPAGQGQVPLAHPSKESPPTIERARQQYAEAHGMEVDKVTDKMMEESDEGVEGWACRGLDCAARGPLGNALYRSLRKNPKMAEAYKWLFDDIKKKFRQSWAMTRNFDFVATKRVHMVATSTKQEEVGTWKNSLQLEGHFGGVGIPEAARQAKNYINNCLKYEDGGWEAFVKWNSWTEAYNYLLVEKLVTKCEEEVWKEMAVMVDQGATFETESFKCQAMRKYAAYYKMPVENVTMEMVTTSPRGVRGWCEIQVTVPGISDKTTDTSGDKDEDQTGTTKTRKGKRGAESAGSAAEPSPKAKAKAKSKPTKKEPTALQASESASKVILGQLARSQQIMNKICSHGDEIPSEWRWAKPFLEEYRECIGKFADALVSEDSQDLTEFVDNLKLSSLDKKTMATFKKSYKDNYTTLLALFVDRTSSLASQKLASHKYLLIAYFHSLRLHTYMA